MEHKYTENITCPYCNWEDEDSWEMEEDSSEFTCGGCGKEFNVERHIEITYSTKKISCDEIGPDIKHKYEYAGKFISKRKFEKGAWTDISEKEWVYNIKMKCAICEDTTYKEVTKEEFYAK